MRKLPLSLLLVLPVVCEPAFVPPRPVPPLTASGELVVLTTNSATTRYIDSQGRYAGLEYDLIEMFAKEQGVKVRYLDRQPLYKILPALRHNTAHLAAAGLAITSDRLDDFEFGPAYQMVQPVIAYNTDNPAPRSVKDVVGKRIEVVRGSSGVEELRALRKRFPKLRWIRSPGGRQRGPAQPPVRRQDRLRRHRGAQPRRDAQLLSQSRARLSDRRPRAAGVGVPQGRRSRAS